MRDIRYSDFSLNTHGKNIARDRASVCLFELTFACDLHCKHCYTDCFNRPGDLKRELSTRDVKRVLDECREAGVLWLCLTGGDPLKRDDFPEIYSYAAASGFITTVFTNGSSITGGIMAQFRRRPPFVVEITLNSVSEGLYERISRSKGSFAKVMRSIRALRKDSIPLKIKTQVTRDNLKELPGIKKFVEGLGLKFTPDHILHPRLDGDPGPCGLRIGVSDIVGIYGTGRAGRGKTARPAADRGGCLFPCTVENGDGFNVDPYGNISLCALIREPRVNVLETGLREARGRMLSWMRREGSTGGSVCSDCESREICEWCPGKAYAETGCKERPIEYYCELSAAMRGGR